MTSKRNKQPVKVTVVNQTTKKSKKKSKPRITRSVLDGPGAAYARLLHDPCGAPLVHPTYAGGDAGFLFRADAVATFGGGAGINSGLLHWTPGYINGSNTDLLLGAATSPAANITVGNNGSGPGKAFLLANAFGARCVAACIKISYPGTEQLRSGRIHYGHTSAGTIDDTDVVTVNGVAPLLQHYTRTPPEIVEVIWRPGNADQEFNDPNAAASALIRDRKTALTVVWAGLPDNVGMTFHFTAIYEWQPRPTTGVSTNVSGKNPSSNTLDHVIDYLQNAGFAWVRNAAGHMGAAASQGLMAGLSNTFGIMPSRPTTRSAIQFR